MLPRPAGPVARTDHRPADAPSGTAADQAHRTTTAERGAFAFARCSCGWQGPARRARDRARRDAAEHTAR
ncbi:MULTISPECIES: hypothetical protein [Streptomycetaceae]|uniref:Uncharacterized protein n=1 Tax=Streptantibioticus cattleyicolor (strain ATCC 35852 / DSM 46488 / JCM 4925 / NBRC 14057 / NRRL 8057) TaxID=1003195 RepID=F8K256_STREN|nr:hypothetical protein [Streptantibioticus cattleyicolor]AEW94942.1 hypothetical protein SCATT_25710 [Streptantibioticus cattleyicolor NRRL 8057 = DSM 46488]MYS59547.1 hypothetical protein [Streptomyces sp. SID5468]CCB75292.1 conserved protein of unknown function [Streptantibioticus cattleyicolor NRRL 8057 = DSM 46488]